MSVSTKITFPVFSFRKVGSPYEEQGETTYTAVVNVKDIPEQIDEWRAINVRDPKLTGGVAGKIRESLTDEPENFFFKNRGMTLTVSKANFDNQTNSLSIELADPKIHGLLDGGHTFKVIREYLDSLEEGEKTQINAFAKIEIIEGIANIEEVVSIVEARNTSTQVRAQSLEELKGNYDQIKQVLQGKPYADSIAYKEYELSDEGLKKDLDIRDLLSYLICFDVESYSGSKHPIIAYSSKGAVIAHFKADPGRMLKYIPLLPKILELRDHIYATLPDAHNGNGGKFGKLTDVGERKKQEKLVFSGESTKYKIPSGFIYPILAAFRATVRCEDGKCSWRDDPIEFYDSIRVELAERIVEQAIEFRNPNKMGKDKATWGRCYDLVKLSVLERSV